MKEEKIYNKSEEVFEDILEIAKDKEVYDEIFKEIKKVKVSQMPEDLRRVLLLVRRVHSSGKGDMEVLDLFYTWMQMFLSEQSDSFVGQLNWWVKMYIEKYMTDLRPVFDAIEDADEGEDKESLDYAKKLIRKLDRNEHKYNIITLNKRINILEKRLDRSVNDNFSSLIKSLRLKRGLSLAETGKLAGVSASYINRMEIGDRKAPSIPILEKIADALGVDVSVLLVAAGVITNPSEKKYVGEIFFSSDIYSIKDDKPMSKKKKEKLVQLIDFIEEVEWEENRHIETIELINLANELIMLSKSEQENS